MHVHTPTELGLLIRGRRRELGLDQQALAKRVGVSRLWIIEIEQGKPRAEVGLVLRTLLALGLRLDVSEEGKTDGRGATQRGRPRLPPPPDIDAIVDAARKKRS